MGAGLCALASVTAGRMLRKRYEDRYGEVAKCLSALEKMEGEMRFFPESLPALLSGCAPDKEHFFSRLAQAMEMKPAASVQSLLKDVPPPGILPEPLQRALERLLTGLSWPEEAFRQKILSETIALWKKETEAQRQSLLQKGSLITKLSLYLGCALFILFC